MQIHELKVKAKKTRKRVGRGGKRGTYSGRGMKGQKARSGGNIDPLFEGGKTSLIQKLKKKRGFKSIKPKKVVINLNVIENNFSKGDKISINSLIEKGLIRKNKAKNGVKILGNGELKKRVTVSKEIFVSDSAMKKIEKVGGTVELFKKSKK